MTKITRFSIVSGLALVVLGVGFYLAYMGTPESHWTALIPAIIGLPIFLCGLVARNPEKRMMAAHIAATFGLLGALGGLGRAVPKLVSGQVSSAVIASLLMGAICTIYVIACVQSFIAARKARG